MRLRVDRHEGDDARERGLHLEPRKEGQCTGLEDAHGQEERSKPPEIGRVDLVHGREDSDHHGHRLGILRRDRRDRPELVVGLEVLLKLTQHPVDLAAIHVEYAKLQEQHTAGVYDEHHDRCEVVSGTEAQQTGVSVGAGATAGPAVSARVLVR